MRLLVDTHAFFWWLTVDKKLSPSALSVLEDDSNEVLVSSVVVWELATKSRLGRWPEASPIVEGLDEFILASGLRPLPITIGHGRLAGLLAGDHRDPFDRMLAAQARIEEVPLVTVDRAFARFGVDVLW
jgi:PIN domain nuclease of toxin-antitoxin system